MTTMIMKKMIWTHTFLKFEELAKNFHFILKLTDFFLIQVEIFNKTFCRIDCYGQVLEYYIPIHNMIYVLIV